MVAGPSLNPVGGVLGRLELLVWIEVDALAIVVVEFELVKLRQQFGELDVESAHGANSYTVSAQRERSTPLDQRSAVWLGDEAQGRRICSCDRWRPASAARSGSAAIISA